MRRAKEISSLLFRMGISAAFMTLVLHAGTSEGAREDAVVATAPVSVKRLLEEVSQPGISAEACAAKAETLFKALEEPSNQNEETRQIIYPAAKRMILAGDPQQTPIGARLLDIWSEFFLAGDVYWQALKDDPKVWTEALGICVARQTWPASWGGASFRRILFRHAWDRDGMSALDIRDRRLWTRDMVKMVHSDSPIVAPFFLSALWSMPFEDRARAVRQLGSHLNSEAARLLVGLTLHTLVPQEMVDTARYYLGIHGNPTGEIIRNLAQEVRLLRVDHPEESLWLKDALGITLRAASPEEKSMALRRTVELLESNRFFPDLRSEVDSAVEDVFSRRQFMHFGMGYAVLTALYDKKYASLPTLHRYLNDALMYNPHDVLKGARYLYLRTSRIPWLAYMGRLARDTKFPSADRRAVLQTLLAVPMDDRYEDALRDELTASVEAGAFSRSDYDSWLSNRKATR